MPTRAQSPSSTRFGVLVGCDMARQPPSGSGWRPRRADPLERHDGVHDRNVSAAADTSPRPNVIGWRSRTSARCHGGSPRL